jgi:glycerophosphoryl diester phosphodiesterase
MRPGIAEIVQAVLGRLRATWQPLLAIHLVYAALGVVLLAPLTGVLLRLLIGFSGQPALADQDILYFLLTPLGMASMILVAAILVAIMALEQASMMAVAAGVVSPRVADIRNAVGFAASRAPRILMLGVLLVVRLLLLAAPYFAAGAAAAWLLITDHDINYYLQARTPAFWTAATLIGLLLALLSIVVLRRLLAWSLALPLVLFADVSPSKSFRESERITLGERTVILEAMLLWSLAALVLSALAFGLVRAVGGWVAPLFFDSLVALVFVLGALVTVWLLANVLAAGFSAGTFALAIVVFAERLAPGFKTAEREDRQSLVRGLGWRVTGPRLALLLLVGLVIAVLMGAWLSNGVATRDEVAVIAHRGAAGKAPENTLASVRQAVEDGADWIEIDVQETADGEVVVIHDSDFMKLAGKDLKVWDAKLAEIDRIDVGSWFDPSFATERVPTLGDVLAAARGKAKVVIELKYYGYDQDLERRVVQIVEDAGMASAVAVMSLKYKGIQKIRALRPDWTIGLLSAKGVGDLTKLDADFLAVNQGMATPGFVRRAQAAGKQVFVWTIDDPVSMSRMISIGVDGIITDEPELARQVLAQRASLSSVERLLLHTAVLLGKPTPPRTYRDESP